VVKASGIEEVRVAYGAPRMNDVAECFPGSVRRECLDHMIVLGDRQLERTLKEYAGSFNRDRPHQGLGQDVPEPAEVPAADCGSPPRVRSVPVLGGLHHTYHRAA
jgi:transposase InsO family protein